MGGIPQAGQGTLKVAPLAHSLAVTTRFTRQDVVVVGTEEGGERGGPLPAALPPRRGATGQQSRSLPTGVSGLLLSYGLGTRDGPAAGAAGCVAGVRLLGSSELPCMEHMHKPERTRSSSRSRSLGFP